MTRRRLPDTRESKIHKIVIRDNDNGSDYDLYITTGYYEDGMLGEVFLSIGKMGSTLQGLLDGWAMLLSVAMQYGIPLESLENRFVGSNFPPAGATSDGLPCTSVFDFVMRYLLKEKRAQVTQSA